MLDSIVKVITGKVKLRGDTDGTLIGNNSDSIKVHLTNGGSGGTSQADESTFTEGTTSFTPIGGVFNETIASDPTEDQAAAARITAKRAIHSNLRNSAGTEVGTTTNPLYNSIRGNTDGTLVGNVSDRIKVDFQDMQKATFILGSTSIAIGNNKSMLSLLNADATKIVRLREVLIYNSATSAVTGIIGDFQLFRFTGHSGGTSLTPASYDTSDSLDSDITARTGGTISGESASALRRWLMSTDDWGTGTNDVEATDHTSQNWGLPLYKHDSPFQRAITLRQNQGIHLKHVINSTAGSFDVYFVFTEE